MGSSRREAVHDQGGWRNVLVRRWRIAQTRSVVGPGDPGEHLAHAEAMAGILDEPEVAVDLGSGAGIPGLALAGMWPQSSWVLIDAARRRVRLMEETVEELDWRSRVSVVHGRAEELGRNPRFRGVADLVTSRSFGRPAVAAECGAPFLAIGGVLAVTEPPEARGDRWDADGLATLGLVKVEARSGVQLLRVASPTPARFPRRPGMPEKRPLF